MVPWPAIHFRFPRPFGFARRLFLANLGILVLLLATVSFAVRSGHDAYTARAQLATEGLAQALATAIASEIRQVDNALISTIQQMDRLEEGRGAAPQETMQRIADEQRGLLPQVDVVRVTDDHGIVLNAADRPTTSIADRDYFQSARARPAQLVISEPLQGRITGRWSVILARARAPQAQFRGVVYANLSSDHFVREFNDVRLGPHGAITLRSLSLRLVARYTPGDRVSNAGVGTSQVSAQLRQALAVDPDRGFFISRTAIDGIERTTAYQRVGDYPFLLFVGLATEDYYRSWRREAAALVGLATLLEAVILGLTWFALASHDRQARDEQALRRLNAEQQALVDNELVGMAKLKGRVAVWHNKALAALFGYEPGELVGQPSRVLYPSDEAWEAVGSAYGALDEGHPYRTQVQMRRKDGRLVWIDLSGVGMANGESLWLMVDITAVKQSEADARRLALQDPLTGLANRAQLAAALPQLLRDVERAGRKAAVCYLDLDGFKAVNDRHGHECGDVLLREVARRILACVRGNDIVARMGGDEFVVALAAINERAELDIVLGRILASVAAPVELRQGLVATVGTSIGVAIDPDHGRDAAALLELADQAMYAAKRAGGQRFAVHAG
jgi:diguanylate cyclase (GGDEF)-like protein/PAS domain S-box-containing protein